MGDAFWPVKKTGVANQRTKSGGKPAAVQTLREILGHRAGATAFGVRWLQHRCGTMRGQEIDLVSKAGSLQYPVNLGMILGSKKGNMKTKRLTKKVKTSAARQTIKPQAIRLPARLTVPAASGFFSALVTDNNDPINAGRVKVRISLPGRESYEGWARVSTFMAGRNKGSWFMPDVNDEVLVAFGVGTAGGIYVVGGLWSKVNRPPETMNAGNDKKVLCSRNGVTLTLDDQAGQESIIMETPGGQKFTLKDGPGSVEIRDSNGNSVTLEPSGVTVNAAAKVTLNATAVEISSGLVMVNAGMSKFSGVVQCDTLISNSVVSNSYTPGAGNIW